MFTYKNIINFLKQINPQYNDLYDLMDPYELEQNLKDTIKYYLLQNYNINKIFNIIFPNIQINKKSKIILLNELLNIDILKTQEEMTLEENKENISDNISFLLHKFINK